MRSALREVVRAILVEALSEAVQLTPQQFAVKQALEKTNTIAAQKANVLFLRLASKRIGKDEAEQMADEVRSMIAKDPQATKLFNSAFADAQAKDHIGGLISSTLAEPQAPQPGQSISIRSVARA